MTPRWLRPGTKLKRAAWVEKNRDKCRAYARKYAAKFHTSGRLIPCATLLCKGTFRRTPHNGRRLFCHACQLTFGYMTARMSAMGTRTADTRRAAW